MFVASHLRLYRELWQRFRRTKMCRSCRDTSPERRMPHPICAVLGSGRFVELDTSMLQTLRLSDACRISPASNWIVSVISAQPSCRILPNPRTAKAFIQYTPQSHVAARMYPPEPQCLPPVPQEPPKPHAYVSIAATTAAVLCNYSSHLTLQTSPTSPLC